MRVREHWARRASLALGLAAPAIGHADAGDAAEAVYAPEAAFAPALGPAPEAGAASALPPEAAPAVGPPPASVSPALLGTPRTLTTETRAVSVSRSRLSAGYASEKVEAVAEPKDSDWMTTFSFGYSGDSDGMMKSGIGTFGARYLDPTGDFPGADGGFRLAFSFEINAQGLYGEYTVPSYDEYGDDGDETTESFGQAGATLGVGLNLLSFGALDQASLTQSGFMVKLGLGVGAAWASGGASDGLAPLIAPQFGLEFPSYNPGTGEFSSFAISGFVIPLDPVVLALSLGGSL